MSIATGFFAPFAGALLLLIAVSAKVKKRVAAIDASAAGTGPRTQRPRWRARPASKANLCMRHCSTRFRTTCARDRHPLPGELPSLTRLIDTMEMRHNLIFGLVAFALMWGLQVSVTHRIMEAGVGEGRITLAERRRPTRGTLFTRGLRLRAPRRSFSRAGGRRPRVRRKRPRPPPASGRPLRA